MMKIKGDKSESKLLRWLKKHLDFNSFRPYTKGIGVLDGRVVATDGKRIVITPTPKCLANAEDNTIIDIRDVGAGEFEIEADEIKATYPNPEEIISNLGSSNDIVGFDPKLMVDILSGLKGLATISTFGRSNPIEISGISKFNNKKVYALLMPMMIKQDFVIERPRFTDLEKHDAD
jgi:hypothetical protein